YEATAVPAWPCGLTPQQYASPLVMIAQLTPAAVTDAAPPNGVPAAETKVAIGTNELGWFAPVPSRPLPPSPQHHSAPLASIAHVASWPAEIETMPVTAVESLAYVAAVAAPAFDRVTPLPTWPSSFLPQHHTAPPVRRMQL